MNLRVFARANGIEKADEKEEWILQWPIVLLIALAALVIGSAAGYFYRKNGCMQIIDGSNTGYPELSESLIRISGRSDPGLIQTNPERPAQPPAPIGPEPEHGYCWYFQQTALAQQSGDIGAAHDFASEALRSGLHPTYASDLAPLVLAFLQSADFENAEAMLSNNQVGSNDWNYLCGYWKTHLTDNNGDSLKSFYHDHNCR